MTETAAVGPIQELTYDKDGQTYTIKTNGILPLCYDCLKALLSAELYNLRARDHKVVCSGCVGL